ncbi:hypothetical protein GA0111570_10914 [Raineyella antarctica]|uniref:DUF3592 domain-containing protein n=1 Tax=Raineyella antarctica TaxID=1577474 RepID=A0A1G6HEL8_9ACTN|nr:DUF3592 domain-containing protein [Raineyella antarctica]SDB92375.1 hypothetical protein GA0111570_10914 [Raineyella antarctica]
MGTVGSVFAVVGFLLLAIGAVLLSTYVVVRLRVRHWRQVRVLTIGAISKLPRLTSYPHTLEVTYLDPDGRPYVLRQRWNGAFSALPSVGDPVPVRHEVDRPEVAGVDSPLLGALVTARLLRIAGLGAVALGTLSVLVGVGLLSIMRSGHLG